jgi:hypothetical protein
LPSGAYWPVAVQAVVEVHETPFNAASSLLVLKFAGLGVD